MSDNQRQEKQSLLRMAKNIFLTAIYNSGLTAEQRFVMIAAMRLRPFQLATVSGIPLMVDYLWLPVAVVHFGIVSIFYLPDRVGNIGLTTAFIFGAVLTLLMFASIVAHELAHALIAKIEHIRTLEIRMHVFGGYARLGRPTRGTVEEVVVSFAGPAANLAIGGVLYWWLNSEQGGVVSDHSWRILWRVADANLALGIFNLLPGYPLDGGHIARAVLTNFMKRNRARVIVGYIGAGIGLLLVGLGLQSGGLGFTVFLGILLIISASQEIQAAKSSRF